MKRLLLSLALAGSGVLGSPLLASAAETGQASPSASGWSAVTVSAMHKLTATEPGVFEPFPPDRAGVAALYAARGEWVNCQVVVTAGDQPLRNVRVVAAKPEAKPDDLSLNSQVSVFHEHFVRVTQPSGNRRLEKLWWADALIPQDWQQVDIPPRRSAAFWIAIRVREDAAAPLGGELQVSTSEGSRNLSVHIAVLKVKVPAPTMRATAALYYDVLRDWYSKNIGPRSDADWAATKRAYYDFLLDYRINAYDLPVGPEEAAFADYARDPRITAIRTPPLGTPELAPFLAALDANGARGKAFYYRHDEPSPDQYPVIVADGVKLHAMGVKQLVTAQPNAKLLKAVDIWCPSNGDALGLGHLDLDALARARKRGEETWWYTMTVPRAPYPTWLLDDDASSVRLYGWQMARWGFTGFVYSMVHGWGPKPLEDLRSFAGSNGDGTLLYPGEMAGGHGPMPSIRLMLLRDAIEDYELLNSLPETQRLAVTSHVVGHFPSDRIDEDAKWQSDSYHALLFSEMSGERVEPNRHPHRGREQFPVGSATTPHATDGAFGPREWEGDTAGQPYPKEVPVTFRRFAGDTLKPSATRLYLAQSRYDYRLFVAVRVADAGPNEWCAVELAPADTSERWRMVITSGGKTALERHTREGRFRMEGLDWKGAAKADGAKGFIYEWNIPLDLVVGTSGGYRINALRRVDDVNLDAKYQVRAWPDDGDVTLMPDATVVEGPARFGQPAARSAKPKPTLSK